MTDTSAENFWKLIEKKYAPSWEDIEEPEPDEIEALMEGRKDREENGTVPHEAINWD